MDDWGIVVFVKGKASLSPINNSQPAAYGYPGPWSDHRSGQPIRCARGNCEPPITLAVRVAVYLQGRNEAIIPLLLISSGESLPCTI